MNYTDPNANVPYQMVRINGRTVSAQLIRIPVHGKMFRLSADSYRAHGEALGARDGWNRVKNKEAGTQYQMEDVNGASASASPAAAASRVGIRHDGDNVVITVPRSAL